MNIFEILRGSGYGQTLNPPAGVAGRAGLAPLSMSDVKHDMMRNAMDFLCVRHRRVLASPYIRTTGYCVCRHCIYFVQDIMVTSIVWLSETRTQLIGYWFLIVASISCVRAYTIPLIVFLQIPQVQPSAPSSNPPPPCPKSCPNRSPQPG